MQCLNSFQNCYNSFLLLAIESKFKEIVKCQIPNFFEVRFCAFSDSCSLINAFEEEDKKKKNGEIDEEEEEEGGEKSQGRTHIFGYIVPFNIQLSNNWMTFFQWNWLVIKI